MEDATYPTFNNHMFINIKIKAYGGGGGIILLHPHYFIKSITQIFLASNSGIQLSVTILNLKIKSSLMSDYVVADSEALVMQKVGTNVQYKVTEDQSFD